MEKIISNFSSFDGLVGFVFFFLIAVILFLLFREILLWYWRINETVDSLKRIADNLELIALKSFENTKKEESEITEETTSAEDEEEKDLFLKKRI